MKRTSCLLTIAGLACSLTLSTGCDDGSTEAGDESSGETDGDSDLVEVSGDLTEDTTWTADKEYVLSDFVFIKGATLTIEPGTTIRGLSGSALVIEKDAMIMAEGTADAPIVFTSNEDSPSRGDWGGLVLLGNAVTNIGTGQAEGFPVPPTYGGDDDSHDCGTLRYVRVEYAGYALSDGNELNGIGFFACGSGTEVSYVQSHMGLDDGIEMFGGTFDIDHIVVTGANDDSLDMDQGFRGTATHVFIHQDPAVGDNCFEISNQSSDFSAEPKTAPMFCNVTCVGSGASGEKSKGLTVKEGTYATWQATIVTNTANEATLLNDDATADEAAAGNIVIENNIFFGNGNPEHQSESMTIPQADWDTWIWDEARANLMSDPGLASAEWGAPDPTPSGDVSGNGTSCAEAGYIGAVDPSGDNWTAASWINYTP